MAARNHHASRTSGIDPLQHWRRKRWAAATLLPSALATALVAGTCAAMVWSSAEAPAEHRSGVGGAGAHAEDVAISPELLAQAAHPREPVAEAQPETAIPPGPLEIPAPLFDAYTGAADQLAAARPECGLHWSLLASVGRVESGHAQAGRVDARGTTVSAILGPRLSGSPDLAAVPDTDAGRLDGDPRWDRAIGAMQFLPETWRTHGADGNQDGLASPHNVHDAALTAGRYLCSGGADLREPRAFADAVLRYNQSENYVRTVLRWANAYARGEPATPEQSVPEAVERDVLAGHRIPAIGDVEVPNGEPAVVELPPPGNSPVPGPPQPPSVFPESVPPSAIEEPGGAPPDPPSAPPAPPGAGPPAPPS